MRKILGFFLALSLTAGTALPQDTPTGITKGGTITLLRTESKIPIGPAVLDNTMDLFTGGFQISDYTNYTPAPSAQVTTIGPCAVVVTDQQAGSTGVVVTALDAGPVLNLNGPNGNKQFAARTAASSIAYGGTLGGGIALPLPGARPPAPLYLDPGTYTVDNGTGGADIGPFTATLTLPNPTFAWTNPDANPSIARSTGVDIQWTGGDPGAKVIIQGVSSATDSSTGKSTGIGSFTCSVDNTGDFFVTPDVLSILPATTSRAIGTLSVSSGVQASFDARGSDASTFVFQSGGSRTVVYQ